MSRIMFALVAASALLIATPAEAKHKKTYQVDPGCNIIMPCEGVKISERGQHVVLYKLGFGSAVQTYTPSSGGIGPRPGRWCGWFMQHETGVTSRATGRNLNRAREWAHIGSNAGGPRVGAIVVWRHHVGKIVGQASNGQWIVRSGNDGHAVRERPRSVAGAIAFRTI